jgi:acetyl-CoA synthetase
MCNTHTHTHTHSTHTSGAHVGSATQYSQLYKESIKDPEKFWESMAKENLIWDAPFSAVKFGSLLEGDVAWFLNGKLNACVNCVDRHIPSRGDKTAIIWESDEPGETKNITYKELLREVCRVANALKAMGVRKGDAVTIYMPMVPEIAYTMLACARIGAPHSVVFAGFSSTALASRINNCQTKWVVTTDQGKRGGRTLKLKEIVDVAVEQCPVVKHVFVFKRTGAQVPFKKGRDVWMDELVKSQRPYCPAEPMDSEDTLFLLYTSGSTGAPKGVQHTTAGYLLWTSTTHRYVFDLRENDVYACVADCGWITGHSYIVYGPLCNGATTVIFESTPLYPDCGRYWDMVERLKV